MTIHSIAFVRKLPLVILLATLLSASSLVAQAPKLPGPGEVKLLLVKYQEERARVVKDGIAQRFVPALMDKADELAKKAAIALAAGRLLQASEAVRQARWQLPYQPVSLPDHVSRIIGSLRLRHSGEITAVAYNPDGSKLASASSDGTVKIWDLGNGHEWLTYTGHTDKVKNIAWTLDGKRIVSSGAEKNIKVWNAQTGADLQTIAAAGENVSALLLSRDGKYIFAGESLIPGNPTNGLFVYETATGKLVREVRDFANAISTMAMNPEGSILATGDENGTIRLFQFPSFVTNANEPAYWTQQDASGATDHLTFSPDGKTLARCGGLGVKIYATVQPNTPFQVASPLHTIATNLPRRAVFSKDGKTLFTGAYDGNIQHWDPETGQLVGGFKSAYLGLLNGLAFNAEGTQLASCASDYVIRLWDFNEVLQARDLQGHDAPVWTAAFSPDGQKIVSASADKTVKVWDRDTGKVLFTLTDHNAPVTGALFSPDGKLIASAGGDKIVRIWDADTGKPLRTGVGHQGTITFLDFSPDSKRIVSGSSDRHIKIWDALTGKELLPINDNPSIVAGVAFSPDGKQIAVANVDQTIRLYDALAGKLQHSWNAHGTAVNSVAYSPNGAYLVSGGADMTVQIWPLATPGVNNIRLTGHTGPVSMVAFRNDNIHLVSCGADRLIKLWKLEGNAGKELQTFRGHRDWVTSVAFSKDGYYLASSSVDRTIKIWEITSKDIPLLAEHTGAVETVAVSPDGAIIASGSTDRTIKLWNRKTGSEIATLTGHLSSIMSLAFTPDSKGLISSGGEASIRIWDISPPREVQRSAAQMTAFSRLRRYSPYIALDPAGKTLFVWLNINEPRVSTIVEAYELSTGNQLFTFSEDSRKINSLAFCANGKRAATGAADGSVRIWEMKPNSANPIPGGDWFLFNKIGVADLALTPDGATLMATNDEGKIKIAKVAGREVRKTIQGHKGKVLACVNSPDGKAFATLGEDNVLKVWDVETGKELRRWQLSNHRDQFTFNLAFTPDSRQLITANKNTTVYVLDLP